ncbi:hypothetical protein Pan44_27100 [Caulifigura coniformis]|uniref:Uncharacterized protein n=1 Tax=Caulifigura coniformis TaxID=2527983 RepID=A0A517SEW2_9PLAN|nr:hypothetical protein [Caulifigura coniformis]QDT54675.1 hypothetical protein Pan44_27100 [Caulifigura coniformis]
MKFKISHIEPTESPDIIAIKGELAVFTHVMVDVSKSPPVATAKRSAGGIQDARILDALAEGIGEAAAEAVNDKNRGKMVKKGRGYVLAPRNGYTGEVYDNSPIGKVRRILQGQNLEFTPPAAEPEPAPLRARAVLTVAESAEVAPPAEASPQSPPPASPSVDSVGTEQPAKTPTVPTTPAPAGAKTGAATVVGPHDLAKP